MTRDSDFKQVVRARMAETGEGYTAHAPALRAGGVRRRAGRAGAAGRPAVHRRPHRAGAGEAQGARGRAARGGRRFEPGREYAEKEVNEVLLGVHEDFAYLRRELVNYHYLERRGRALPHRRPGARAVRDRAAGDPGVGGALAGGLPRRSLTRAGWGHERRDRSRGGPVRPRVRGVRGGRRLVGAPAPVRAVRPRRLLRLEPGAARDRPLRGDRPSGHAELRARRGLVLGLRAVRRPRPVRGSPTRRATPRTSRPPVLPAGCPTTGGSTSTEPPVRARRACHAQRMRRTPRIRRARQQAVPHATAGRRPPRQQPRHPRAHPRRLREGARRGRRGARVRRPADRRRPPRLRARPQPEAHRGERRASSRR